MSGRDLANPSLLNRLAWAARWRDREDCARHGQNVLKRRTVASDAIGRNSGLALRRQAWQGKCLEDLDAALDQYESLLESLKGADAAGTMAGGRAEKAISVLKRGCTLARGMNYLQLDLNFHRDLAGACEAGGDLEYALDAMKALNGLREMQTA